MESRDKRYLPHGATIVPKFPWVLFTVAMAVLMLSLATAGSQAQDPTPPVPFCDKEPADFELPAFYCPTGQVPEPQCKTWCIEAYQQLQYLNVQNYCQAMEFADAQHTQMINYCMSQYDACLRLGGDPQDCAAEANSCLAKADARWADLHKQITDNYNSVAVENMKAYVTCMANCCESESL